MIPAMRRFGHQITGVSSADDGHAAEYARRHDIPYYTSSVDLLVSREDVDAVYEHDQLVALRFSHQGRSGHPGRDRDGQADTPT
jgi:hypothetical protein